MGEGAKRTRGLPGEIAFSDSGIDEVKSFRGFNASGTDRVQRSHLPMIYRSMVRSAKSIGQVVVPE